jgi:hypothetical protein
MPDLAVSKHAVMRYQQRVADLPAEIVRAILSTPAIVCAANFGAQFVRLSSGHRIVIEEHVVVTILPPDHFRKQVLRVGLGRFGSTRKAHRRTQHEPA